MKTYYKNKNILITGGLGFLGSNLASELVKLGANITIIDNLFPLYGGNLYNVKDIKNDIKIIINNINNSDVFLPLVKESDIIFHFAAQVSYIDSLSMPYEDLSTNSTSTLNILEACRNLNPKPLIVYASSRMVYGKAETSIINEDSPTNPLNLYGIHKLMSEKYLNMYYKDFGIPSITLRITNPFGIRQQIKHSKYSLVGWFISQAMQGKTIQVYGEGNQKRDYIYSDDIINAIIKIASNKESIGEKINIGTGTSSKFKDMVETVIKVVNSGEIDYIPWPRNYENIETGDVNVDISKLKKLTSWEPKYSLEEGISNTYDYYLKNSSYYI